MSLPPSRNSLFPSLKTDDVKGIATLAVADLRRQFHSLIFKSDGRDVTDGLIVTMSMPDLRKLLRVVLSGVEVDEKWYVMQVPGLEEGLKKGSFKSATEHYILHGFLEGRPPQRPKVDEEYYFKTYPDIAQAVKAGKLRSGYEHFVAIGYAEGRLPSPPSQA